ncbi:putative RNA-binding protein (contains PUA domain) [Candidatus Nitrososphaera evergladensis SR1]|jgi:PUA domain protein|uniref:Putative RNA-binding protein (Contains PUA domain) n=1 Tax=Candidatus Nitrososphaera evergladensis SR1 TaxID=1459636 RepID=A0A075MQX6_9ARCH|nr:PUA domain-containing protein [Candidatus Nitrososphaera evergladensis]AIF83956.1 putative RNA-binding protein (contains PUA domain) [Candidatus Nitrososphaera evergladensis SR1]
MKALWPAGTVPKVKTFKVYEVDESKHLLVSDDEITCVRVKDDDNIIIIPFLGGKPETLAQFPSVKVDMGAVKFVCNGAKVLRPGIVEFGSFKKGDIVTVQDQTHGKMLAVGIALEDSEAAKAMQKGYVIDNLHYISDKIWEAYKEI